MVTQGPNTLGAASSTAPGGTVSSSPPIPSELHTNRDGPVAVTVSRLLVTAVFQLSSRAVRVMTWLPTPTRVPAVGTWKIGIGTPAWSRAKLPSTRLGTAASQLESAGTVPAASTKRKLGGTGTTPVAGRRRANAGS